MTRKAKAKPKVCRKPTGILIMRNGRMLCRCHLRDITPITKKKGKANG